jgi:hypothetical protein
VNLRLDPLDVRKATLARVLARAAPGSCSMSAACSSPSSHFRSDRYLCMHLLGLSSNIMRSSSFTVHLAITRPQNSRSRLPSLATWNAAISEQTDDESTRRTRGR